MRKRIKRCPVCASKLDKNGLCPWSGCPKSPNYETDAKELEKTKERVKNEISKRTTGEANAMYSIHESDGLYAPGREL